MQNFENNLKKNIYLEIGILNTPLTRGMTTALFAVDAISIVKSMFNIFYPKKDETVSGWSRLLSVATFGVSVVGISTCIILPYIGVDIPAYIIPLITTANKLNETLFYINATYICVRGLLRLANTLYFGVKSIQLGVSNCWKNICWSVISSLTKFTLSIGLLQLHKTEYRYLLFMTLRVFMTVDLVRSAFGYFAPNPRDALDVESSTNNVIIKFSFVSSKTQKPVQLTLNDIQDYIELVPIIIFVDDIRGVLKEEKTKKELGNITILVDCVNTTTTMLMSIISSSTKGRIYLLNFQTNKSLTDNYIEAFEKFRKSVENYSKQFQLKSWNLKDTVINKIKSYFGLDQFLHLKKINSHGRIESLLTDYYVKHKEIKTISVTAWDVHSRVIPSKEIGEQVNKQDWCRVLKDKNEIFRISYTKPNIDTDPKTDTEPIPDPKTDKKTNPVSKERNSKKIDPKINIDVVNDINDRLLMQKEIFNEILWLGQLGDVFSNYSIISISVMKENHGQSNILVKLALAIQKTKIDSKVRYMEISNRIKSGITNWGKLYSVVSDYYLQTSELLITPSILDGIANPKSSQYSTYKDKGLLALYLGPEHMTEHVLTNQTEATPGISSDINIATSITNRTDITNVNNTYTSTINNNTYTSTINNNLYNQVTNVDNRTINIIIYEFDPKKPDNRSLPKTKQIENKKTVT